MSNATQKTMINSIVTMTETAKEKEKVEKKKNKKVEKDMLRSISKQSGENV